MAWAGTMRNKNEKATGKERECGQMEEKAGCRKGGCSCPFQLSPRLPGQWRTVPPPRLPHLHHQIKHTRSAVSLLGQNSHFPPPAKNAMSQLPTDSSVFQLTLGHAWLLPEWQSDSGLCQRTCQPPGYGPVPQPTRWACFNYSTSNTNHPCTDK